MTADSTGTPTIVSASSTARRIELTAEVEVHDLALPPAFRFRGAERGKLHAASSSSSPISAQVFVLPISSPTMITILLRQIRRSSNLCACRTANRSECFDWRLRPTARAGASLSAPWPMLSGLTTASPTEAQVHRIHAPRRRRATAPIFSSSARYLPWKSPSPKCTDAPARRRCRRGISLGALVSAGIRKRRAQIVRVGKIHLAHLLASRPACAD